MGRTEPITDPHCEVLIDGKKHLAIYKNGETEVHPIPEMKVFKIDFSNKDKFLESVNENPDYAFAFFVEWRKIIKKICAEKSREEALLFLNNL